jgi:hypothetical protein
MKRPVVRLQFHRGLIALMACAAVVSTGAASASQDHQAQAPRVYRAKENTLIVAFQPKIPVAIIEVRNYENDWWKDLEIEVENRSGKPLYLLRVTVGFPHIPKDELGRAYGTSFSLGNGNSHLLSYKQATTEEIALGSRARHVFNLPEYEWRGLASYITKRGLPKARAHTMVLKVSEISFGDGNGFIGGTAFSARQGM